MEKTIVDVCCGSRMFWFDPIDPRCLFLDKRQECHQLSDSTCKTGKRNLVIAPDTVADFTDLPFEPESFSLVVFDPPHLIKLGKTSWLARKYGRLEKGWEDEIRNGFLECFRILQPLGTLIFKWNETDIPVSRILALTPEKPVIGNRCGKASKSHWIVFQKGSK